MSEAVKAQAAVLLDLKRVDEQSYRFRVGLKQIPEEISQIEMKLKSLEDGFAGARAALADAEKKLRAAEQELKAKEDEMFKAEGKMMDVKTNEEYQAAMRENDSRKTAKGALEEKVLVLMDSLEAQRQTLKSLESEHAAEKVRLQNEKKSLEQQKTQLEIDVAEADKTRETFASKLDAKIQTIYRRVSAESEKVAIASAAHGTCGGCNMQVRPQIYNEVVGFTAIHQCGQCRRILIPAPVTAQNAADMSIATSR